MVFSLEFPPLSAFRFLGGLLGGSGHHFRALLEASGGLLGVFGAPWDLLGDPWGPLWAPLTAPWAHLATIWVHVGGFVGDFGLQFVQWGFQGRFLVEF